EFGTLIGASPVRSIVLSTIYRHSAELRALTARVTERVGTSGVVGHRAAQTAEKESGAAPLGAPVVSIRGASQGRERAAIARLLREHHIHRDIPWSRLAVVVRSGALAPGIARSLSLANVPTRT